MRNPEPTAVLRMLEEIRGRRVLVLGDAMLDRYVVVEAVKLSQEAPVVVVRHREQREVPGGAANVALNIRRLGGEPLLVSVAASDEEGCRLRELLAAEGVEHLFLEEEGRPTTLKTRFTDGNQQFFRLDREETAPLPESTMEKAVTALRRLLGECDCVIYSDYAKGFFTPSLKRRLDEELRASGVPVIVDPKPANHYLCEGCFLLIPNRREGALIAGLAGRRDVDTAEIARVLACRFSAHALVTEGKEGMTLCTASGETSHVPSRAREVFDVSGAGDTVAACMALAVAARLDLREGMALANLAAGLVVSKAQTATVTPEEIIQEATGSPKIMERSHLARVVEELRREGRSIVFTNGCFDLLHVGHIRYLRAARELGDVLVVGLNTDESVRRLKGDGRPLISEMQRAELLAAMEAVDYVVLFHEDTPHELISLLRPDVYVKGGDYSVETLPETPLVRSYGGKVVTTPLFGEGISTTSILERIAGQPGSDA